MLEWRKPAAISRPVRGKHSLETPGLLQPRPDASDEKWGVRENTQLPAHQSEPSCELGRGRGGGGVKEDRTEIVNNAISFFSLLPYTVKHTLQPSVPKVLVPPRGENFPRIHRKFSRLCCFVRSLKKKSHRTEGGGDGAMTGAGWEAMQRLNSISSNELSHKGHHCVSVGLHSPYVFRVTGLLTFQI